jgi:hypothetical protein
VGADALGRLERQPEGRLLQQLDATAKAAGGLHRIAAGLRRVG